MTYKELLQSLADRAALNYKDYLQSKIDALVNSSEEFLTEKTQQYKDVSADFEKKFIEVLAIVKNKQGPDEGVSEEEVKNFLHE